MSPAAASPRQHGQVSVTGGAGDDILLGKGSDEVKGGPGDDLLSDFGASDQVLDGEAGTDTYAFDFTPAGQVGLDVTPLNGGLVVHSPEAEGSSTPGPPSRASSWA